MHFGLLQLLLLAGSLGLFIYGMKVMSEGLQKVAGARMRRVLETMTRDRFRGSSPVSSPPWWFSIRP